MVENEITSRLPLDRLPLAEKPRSISEGLFSEEEIERFKREFADRLRIAFNGATNAEIARACVTTRATIKAYTDADRLPIGEMLLRMNRATGINIHWLLTGRGPRRVVGEDLFEPEEEKRLRELARERGQSPDELVRALTLAALDFLENL